MGFRNTGAVLAVMLAALAGAGHAGAQSAPPVPSDLARAYPVPGDLSRCRAVKDRSARLDCYDDLAAAAASPRPQELGYYRPMALAEFKADRQGLDGYPLELVGYLNIGQRVALLHAAPGDLSPVPVDLDGIPREQRVRLYERCATGCNVQVRGTARAKVGWSEVGVVAEGVEIP